MPSDSAFDRSNDRELDRSPSQRPPPTLSQPPSQAHSDAAPGNQPFTSSDMSTICPNLLPGLNLGNPPGLVSSSVAPIEPLPHSPPSPSSASTSLRNNAIRRSQSLSRLSVSSTSRGSNQTQTHVPEHTFPSPTASSLGFTLADDSFSPVARGTGRQRRYDSIPPPPSAELLNRLGLPGLSSLPSVNTSYSSSQIQASTSASGSRPMPFRLSIPGERSEPATPLRVSYSPSAISIPTTPSTSTNSIPTTPITPAQYDMLYSSVSARAPRSFDNPMSTADTSLDSASSRSHSLPRLRAEKTSADQRCINSIRTWAGAKQSGVGELFCHVFSSTSPEVHGFAKGFLDSGYLQPLLDLLWEHARESFEAWLTPKAVGHVKTLMSSEMNALTKAFKFSFSQLTPEFLLGFDLKTTIQPKVKKFAPNVDSIIRNALQTDRAAKDNVDKDPDTVCLTSVHPSSGMLISIIQTDYERSYLPDGEVSFREGRPLRRPYASQLLGRWQTSSVHRD